MLTLLEATAASESVRLRHRSLRAQRGEADKAFEWLDHAYSQHDGGLAFIKGDPIVKGLRGDPPYAAMLKKLGLPPQSG